MNVCVDPSLLERLERLRQRSRFGKPSRSAVVAEALARGLDALEREATGSTGS